MYSLVSNFLVDDNLQSHPESCQHHFYKWGDNATIPRILQYIKEVFDPKVLQ